MSKLEENKQIALAALAAIDRGDWNAMIDLTREDFLDMVMFEQPRVYEREELRQRMMTRIKLAVEGGRMPMTLKAVIAEGDYVITLAKGGSRTKSGFDYANEYSFVWKIVDGKIVECREYMDTALALGFGAAVDDYWKAHA